MPSTGALAHVLAIRKVFQSFGMLATLAPSDANDLTKSRTLTAPAACDDGPGLQPIHAVLDHGLVSRAAAGRLPPSSFMGVFRPSAGAAATETAYRAPNLTAQSYIYDATSAIA